MANEYQFPDDFECVFFPRTKYEYRHRMVKIAPQVYHCMEPSRNGSEWLTCFGTYSTWLLNKMLCDGDLKLD